MTPPTLYCQTCGAAHDGAAEICFACQQPLKGKEAESASLLKGRYAVLMQVGTGGFGAVYKAEDRQEPGRIVAIKQINLRGLSPLQIIEATDAFNREVSLLSDLSHPLLPHIHESFTDPDHWYLVMDFIEGETLEDHLQKRANTSLSGKRYSFPLDDVLDIGLQLAGVLAYLHVCQPPIIFRDLKPANVMCTSKRQFYLIDFGIARHFKPGQLKDTIPFGSPGYAAPEQYGKAQTTPRSDIYSLGALLHFLLSGDDPADNPFSFAPFRLYGQAGLTELETLILRMVELDMNNRPADIDAVGLELQRIVDLRMHADGHLWRPELLPMPQPPPDWGERSFQTWQTSAQQQQAFINLPQPTRRTFLGLGISFVVGATLVAGTGYAAQQLYAPRYHTNPAYTLPNPLIHHAPSPVRAVALFPRDAKFVVSGGDNGTLATWKAFQPDQTYFTLHYPGGDVNSVAYSVKNDYVAIGYSNGIVQVLQYATGNLIYTYQWQQEAVMAVAWAPDGKQLVSASQDKIIRTWNILDSSNVSLYKGHTDRVNAIAWSPDGAQIASGSDDATVRIWDTQTSRTIRTYKGHREAVTGVSWSPEGRYIATSSRDKTVQVWQPLDGKRINTKAHTAPVLTIAWSPVRNLMASGGQDRTIQLWNAISGSNVSTFRGHTGYVYAISWAGDSKYLASGSQDGTVRIWRV